MARIPREVIERLKSEIAIERLAEARGVVFERRGPELHGRCPFHDDQATSLVVTPLTNLWHCLGACQAGGTVIDWVMKAEGVSFRHAVELLRSDSLPAAAASGATPPKRSSVRRLPAPIERHTDDAKLLAQVIDYYHQTLLASPEALDYLRHRGIGSQEAIRTFRVGYANRTLGYRLPDKNRVQGAAIRGQLQRIGVLRESGHEHFNGSIVIPVIAPSGEVTEVYGRKIAHGLRPGTPLHLYLPGPHRGVWNASALGITREVILCEALIDALTFWCAGYRNVTASYGAAGFTPDHMTLLKQCGAQRVLIAYDRDEVGDREAETLAAQLLPEGLDCYRVLFPKGMDANEYALKVTPAVKSLGVVIRSARWMGKGRPKPLGAVSVGVPDLGRESAPAAPSVAGEAASEKKAPPAASVPPPPAQAVPDPPMLPPIPKVKPLGQERELIVSFGGRRYRVRGLEKNLSYEVLKVNLMASAPALDGVGQAVHVDTLDLYHARARATFVQQAAVELGLPEEVIKGDLGKLLLALEAEQEKLIIAAVAPKAPISAPIDDSARARAMALLTATDLIKRIIADFSRCGFVGEGGNALVGYLATISRKLNRPLALLIQGTSAAGKSSLLDAILRFVPREDRIVYSSITGQSLYYMGEMDLKHKLLAIAEEQGASRASYALKLLQSEGELTIASTSKDPATGKLKTQEYRVEGPVMIALTTPAEVDEELLNRCLVLSINEDHAQTRAIHAAQRARRTLAALDARGDREAVVKLHQDGQRLLESLAVVNPYADRLTFLDDRTRTRRDHEKYLTLIDTIALLHQHQRPRRTTAGAHPLRYVEVTLDDIALANRLAHEILGRTVDELPPQTRRLLGLICKMVEQECAAQQMPRAAYRFTRRAVRKHTRWGDTQLKVHLARLAELEYLLVHRGGRGQSFEYELLYDGSAEEQGPHINGLIDVEALRHACTAERSGSNSTQSALGRDMAGNQSWPGRGNELALIPDKSAVRCDPLTGLPEIHGTGDGAQGPSYGPLPAHA
jgi:hypothetical protein